MFSLFSPVCLTSHIDFQRAGWVFKLMQNHTNHKNTPNTTSERTSRLTERTSESIFFESDRFLKSYTQRVSVHKIRKYVKIKKYGLGFQRVLEQRIHKNTFWKSFLCVLLGAGVSFTKKINEKNYFRLDS